MNKFTESARQFTMDGGVSLYDFKDEVGGGGEEEEDGALLMLCCAVPCRAARCATYSWGVRQSRYCWWV